MRTQRRDIVVIGASLGGVQALQTLAAQLPAEFPAAVFIVQHTAADSSGLLAGLLGRAGPLPAAMAEDGMDIVPGRIVIAVPDRHLLLTGDGVRVAFGPRENRSRPSIDPLFRTAAVNYRSRVIGLIMTGLLSDGAAGLSAIQQCGGCALVQSPHDALYPDMPRHASAAAPAADHIELSSLGAALTHLAGQPAPSPPPIPDALRIEAALTERAMTNDDWNGVPSRSTDFTCPECRGALREIEDTMPQRYRCRVGHAYTADELVTAQNDSVEEALWVALQTLEERAQMLETMALDDERRGWTRSSASFTDRAGETRAHAGRLRDYIGRLGIATRTS